MERAEKSRAPIQKTADRLAGYLVYFALGAAVLTFLVTHNVRSTISVVIAGAGARRWHQRDASPCSRWSHLAERSSKAAASTLDPLATMEHSGVGRGRHWLFSWNLQIHHRSSDGFAVNIRASLSKGERAAQDDELEPLTTEHI